MTKRPKLIEGIAVALVLSLICLPLGMFISLLTTGFQTAKLVIALLTLAYICYLLKRSDSRVGRVTLGALSAFGLLSAALFHFSLLDMVFISVGIIWAVRSLCYYSSLLMAVVDACLCILGVGFALWVYMATTSVALATWAFFLAQAVFVFIPRRMTKRPDLRSTTGSRIDRFDQAAKSAEAALGVIIGG